MSELLANDLRDEGYADVVLVGLRRHDEGRTLKTQFVARRDGAPWFLVHVASNDAGRWLQPLRMSEGAHASTIARAVLITDE